MTIWEIVRMLCYVVAAPALLYLAFWLAHYRMHVAAIGLGALSALFVWYMVEITLASSGINTREYRVIGTPMTVIIAIASVMLVVHLRTKG